MSNKNKHINVRFESELYEAIEKVAKANRMSKSDVVRTALSGELAKIDERKNKVLSESDRERMLKNMGAMMSGISAIRNHTNRMNSNLNQVAKAVNSGRSAVGFDLQGHKENTEKITQYLGPVSEELNRIWRTLV